MLPSEYLSKKLTPYPLPTKDGGVLRTIDDARGYKLAMPKRRKLRAPWKHAWRLLLEEAGAAAFTHNRSRFIRWVPAQTNFFLPLGFVPPYLLTKASKPPAGDRRAASNTDR